IPIWPLPDRWRATSPSSSPTLRSPGSSIISARSTASRFRSRRRPARLPSFRSVARRSFTATTATPCVSPYNWTQAQMPDGSAGAPSYSFLNELTSGWYRAGTQDARLSINGADVLQVTGPGAGTPSVVNVLSPNVLQQAGQPVVSGPATTTSGDFVLWNAANGTLVKDGGAPGALASKNTVTSSLLAPGAAPLPAVAPQPNDNLNLVWLASNQLGISPGRVRDDSDLTNLHNAGTNGGIYKRLDTAFAAGGAVGSPAGACDAGTQGANQT